MIPGDYYCVIVDANLCPTIYSDTLTITEPDLLVIDSITQDSISCYGYNDGFLTVYPSGGTIPYSFNWENNDILNTSDSLFSGNYYVIVNDNNGCEVIDSQNVYQPIDIIPPTLSMYYDTICFNSSSDTFSIVNSALGGGGDSPYEYQWFFNNDSSGTVFIGNSLNYQLVNLTKSTKVWVETYSAYGCGPVSSDTIYIHVFDKLTSGSLINPDSICFNTSFGQINFDVLPSGANNNYSYIWQSYDGYNWSVAQNFIDSSLNSYNQDYNLINSTKYRVEIYSNEGCGSVLTPEIDLFVFDNFIPGTISDDQEICYGDIASELYLSSPSEGGNPNTIDSYTWQFDNNGVWDDISNNFVFAPGSLFQDVDYRLKIENYCYSDSLYSNIISIKVKPIPASVDIIGPQNVCKNSSDIVYTLSSYDSTLTDLHYLWYFSSSNQTNFVGTNISYNCLVDYQNSGNFELIIRQRDANNGCFNRDTLLINVNSTISPDKCIIQKSPNTEMLFSDDVSSGIHYQWGYYKISNPSDSFVVSSDTLQFIHYLDEHNHIIDESTNRYWLDTWFDSSCKTRSYFNWNPLPLDLNNIEDNNTLTIFPNPASDKIFYKYDSKQIEVEVFDIVGKKIECRVNLIEKSIDINKFKNGIYFLIIIEDNKKTTKKFIVKK